MSAFKEFLIIPVCSTGHEVAQLVEIGATTQEAVGSIPDLVIGIFH
jgi:hypothetical protein